MYTATPNGFMCGMPTCDQAGIAKPAFADIADVDEDKRIDIIGRTVMESQRTVAFVTDSDPGKADRYIKKLQERFPGIVVVERFDGPVANAVTVKVGPPEKIK